MADNVAVTAGSGTNIATDDIGGAHYQRVKACWGADGSVNDTSAAAPFPVTLTNLEKTEDAAHSSGHSGVMALAVVDTSGAGTSATDGDYAAMRLNSRGALRVALSPPESGDAASIAKNLDVDESEDAVKASAGVLYGLILQNLHTSADRFVKLYNDTVANVIVGTTAPVMTIKVEPNGIEHLNFPYGLAFSNAITIAATTGLADNDTGAPGANEVIASVFYK